MAARNRGRVALFTYNNPRAGFVASCASFEDANVNGGPVVGQRITRQRVIGLVYQHETGAAGTPHIQGCIRLSDNITFRAARLLIQAVAPGAHVEIANGSWADNVAYCTKVDTRTPGTEPVRDGDVDVHPGARSDIADLVGAIREGATPAQLLELNPGSFVRYHGGYAAARLAIDSEAGDRPLPEICVLWGPSGTGKSRWANDHFPNAAWADNVSHKWWDGYAGDMAVIIDDYDGGYPFRFLLKLLDRYPLRLAVKGGHVMARFPNLIITSNLHPRDWYDTEPAPGEPWAGSPLERRLREYGTVVDCSGWDGSDNYPAVVDSDGNAYALPVVGDGGAGVGAPGLNPNNPMVIGSGSDSDSE